MRFGKIIEQGSHDELMKLDEGHYKGLWKNQQMEEELEELKNRKASETDIESDKETIVSQNLKEWKRIPLKI